MRRVIIALAGVPLLAACVTVEAPGPADPVDRTGGGGGECNAAAAQGLVGQKATSESGGAALARTGARTLRWGPPGAMFTMDFRSDRVNVMYDEAMVIREIRCG